MGCDGSSINALIGVDKPQGMTSHDVVNVCRRAFGTKRVGHAGTLDPLATGVLPILVGSATKLEPYLVGHDKAYVVEICFGIATDTDDADGTVIATHPVPCDLFDQDFAREQVEALVGRFLQMPPAFSAIKKDGKKAYEQARHGVRLQLDERPVEVYEAELQETLATADTGLPVWRIYLKVSKGTYIRSIARDLGMDLGVGAHVRSLERVASGCLSVTDCFELDELMTDPRMAILDPVDILGLEVVYADEGISKSVRNGCALPAKEEDGLSDGQLVCIANEHVLFALYRHDAAKSALVPDRVLFTGVDRGRAL